MQQALTLLLVLFSAVSVRAQTSERLPVAIINSSKDDIGRQFAFAVREEFRKSAKFAVAGEAAQPAYSFYDVWIVSIDPTDEESMMAAVRHGSMWLARKTSVTRSSRLARRVAGSTAVVD